MQNSNLVDVLVPAYEGNFTYGRSGYNINAITIHHMAGILSAEQCGYIFQQEGRYGSSHYGIGNDGRIGQYVGEENTAWTNSNWESNCQSVTIETSNCEIGGNWKVSDEALNSLIRLVADIAKRNNLGHLVKGQNVTWHSMFAPTECPGNYLLSKLDYIIEQANKINEATTNVKLRGHIQDIGWTNWQNNEIGTTGESKRLEAIQIDAPDYKIKVKAHIEGIGWVDYGEIDKDTVIGTTGESRRLEALQIIADGLEYQIHVQDLGWSSIVPCGAKYSLGTEGFSKRIEAVCIK